VPIRMVEGERLDETGSPDTARALSDLVPSFNYPQPSLTGGTDIVRPATLRGLGPDEMLVLVNGKRRHVSALLNTNTTVGRGTAAVDMSMLPAAAIDHIEVLQDGAAAQYGSDAIAGVVNVLLKQQREGADVSVTYGQNFTTIHGVARATGVETQPDGQPVTLPNGVYALRYSGDRTAHDGQTVTLSGHLGLPLGAEGFLDIAAQLRDQAPTNRAGYDPREQYSLVSDGPADPREFTTDRLSQRFGEPRIEDANAVLNAGLPLGQLGTEWYLFGTYGNRYALTEGFYRQPDDAGTVPSIYPNGFLPEIKADIDDKAVVTGVRGRFGGWNYDLSANYGRNVINFETLNSDDAALYEASPTSFQDGGMRYQEYLANLDLQRDFSLGVFAGPLSAAWGMEYRAERFAVTAGSPSSHDDVAVLSGGLNPGYRGQVFPGFSSDNVVDQTRHSLSAYVDFEQDLSSRWTLAVAGRAERYSDFGSTLNYKVASRVSLMPGLALRGAVSTGFRAPSLQQQYFSNNSTHEMNGKLLEVGTFAATSGPAVALGATNLKPERSHSLGAGIVFDRVDGLDITLDWYRIAIRDRIVLTENLGTDGTEDQNDAVQAVLLAETISGNDNSSVSGPTTGSASAARFFINGVDTLTQGADLVGTYRIPLQHLGTLRLSASYNYTDTRITRYLDNLDPLSQIPGLQLVGPRESELLTRAQPRSRLNLSADWSRDGLAATVRTNFYGSVFSAGADPLDDLTIRPAWVMDLELRYSRAGWQLALGAENMLDKYPTSEPTGARPASLGGYYDVTNYFIPFSVLSPFGFSGRYLYGRLGYRF
jgi:iron complex outermembrane receptor protein